MSLNKLIITLVMFLGLTLQSFSADVAKIPYKNIPDGGKIVLAEDGTTWTLAGKKDTNYYLKKVSDGSGNFSEFYSPDGEFLFSTGCQYEFIYNGNLIGYSNADLKFYEFKMNDNLLSQRELSEDEILELFKGFKIVRISEFSNSTNSLKIKKSSSNLKLILLNDSDRYFYHYGFSSHNAKYETYPLRGLLNIKKTGLIQFSHFGDNTKENPWFILLIRN